MAASPEFKVYRNGEYVAACKYAEDAAAIAGMYTGTEVRYGHRAKDRIFLEGSEEVNAADSWDGAAAIMHQRVEEMRNRAAR